jgi:hypothetical protein
MKALIALVFIALATTKTVAEPLPPISTCNPVGFQYDYLTLGRHIAVLCTKPLGDGVYVNGLSCTHAVCSPSNFGLSVAQIIGAASPKTELQAQWTAKVKWTCDAPPDATATALCAERQKWVSDNWATWTAGFKPAVWRVKVNSTYATRPAYTLTADVLGTKEVARATVGNLCDVSKPTAPASNGDIRAEFGVPGVVTLCARVP